MDVIARAISKRIAGHTPDSEFVILIPVGKQSSCWIGLLCSVMRAQIAHSTGMDEDAQGRSVLSSAPPTPTKEFKELGHRDAVLDIVIDASTEMNGIYVPVTRDKTET